jgi:hypothetical protein
MLVGCASDGRDPGAASVDDGSDYHRLALYDRLEPAAQRALQLPFDAYVVGLEKRWSFAGVPRCPPGGVGGPCLDIDGPYFTARPAARADVMRKLDGQMKRMYVSHIARFDAAAGGAPCFLLNPYDAARPCGEPTTSSARTDLSTSWSALSVLGDDMARVVAERKPSHVVLYAMGWNTLQAEALDNVRELGAQLLAAARQAGDSGFRPLFILTTWPSTWKAVLGPADYGPKAKDADEAGLVWQNVLINRELRRVKPADGFKLIVVGHSFGARLTTRATFSAPLVSRQVDPIVDLVVGLQGAYSYQRFVGGPDGEDPDGQEGAPYADHARLSGPAAMTASAHDTAVTAAGHERFFVGSHRVFQRTQAPELRQHFAHAATDDKGLLGDGACAPGRVLMIDASALIKDRKPGTGGGAHSGIYTEGVGRLVHQLIRRCVSTP